MKKIIVNIVLFFSVIHAFAQPTQMANTVSNTDTVTILLNAKTIATFIVKNNKDDDKLIVKKIPYNKIKSIVVQITGASIQNSRYAKSLTVSGNPDISIAETKNQIGYFDISNSSIKKRLSSGKSVPLHLVLNPANSMMLMSSRIIFLGNLVMQ